MSLLIESKMFEGIGSAAKKLFAGLLSGKVKKVAIQDSSKESKNVTAALKIIVDQLEELDDYLDDNPEFEAALMAKLKNS